MVPARGSNPNWMKLSFTEELSQKTPIVIVIDHKCEHARRALGALIQHLWISCENWTIYSNSGTCWVVIDGTKCVVR